ncbi:flagellar hook protein FlgE [Photobacterium aphoticum]|uniref:Flagellar hook protein FlgE n=3 Tax=Photobacterium aphoticum TaxID=754436 RepID=A0A0J1JFM6_9GAMM|nr:flagellar hook protein FlgE [Photobacterium aphoticum]KLV00627.1 flagellar hook protein FlgE [Photobacterium aphoticum]GHA58968.1 flagellar hook protein FlgE [Photobacterium aphoticum]
MSINVGLSGLRATSEQMNTISHNIANVGTVGYKSSRTEFQDIYAPEFGGGQMNGVEVAAVRQSFMTGTTTPTGRNGDLAINGEGFFMVKSNGQDLFTRNGVFSMDADGYLVSSDGSRLQGYGVTATGTLQTGTLSDLRIATGDMPSKQTSSIDIGLNLDANSAIIDTTKHAFDPEDPSTFTSSATSTVYDSLGGEHEVTQYYVKTADNTWKVHYRVDGEVPTSPKDGIDMTFDGKGNMTAPTAAIDLAFTPDNGAAAQTLAMNVSEVTQFGSEFSINKNTQNGHAPGQVAGWYFDADGSVYTRYSNGEVKQQGQVALARFPNQEGLQQAGGTAWTHTFASGSPLVGAPGTGQLGALRTGMYENSNVDLTSEMVGLMSAQSNYQANAKTIQVAQEMTQILFQNL